MPKSSSNKKSSSSKKKGSKKGRTSTDASNSADPTILSNLSSTHLPTLTTSLSYLSHAAQHTIPPKSPLTADVLRKVAVLATHPDDAIQSIALGTFVNVTIAASQSDSGATEINTMETDATSSAGSLSRFLRGFAHESNLVELLVSALPRSSDLVAMWLEQGLLGVSASASNTVSTSLVLSENQRQAAMEKGTMRLLHVLTEFEEQRLAPGAIERARLLVEQQPGEGGTYTEAQAKETLHAIGVLVNTDQGNLNVLEQRLIHVVPTIIGGYTGLKGQISAALEAARRESEDEDMEMEMEKKVEDRKEGAREIARRQKNLPDVLKDAMKEGGGEIVGGKEDLRSVLASWRTIGSLVCLWCEVCFNLVVSGNVDGNSLWKNEGIVDCVWKMAIVGMAEAVGGKKEGEVIERIHDLLGLALERRAEGSGVETNRKCMEIWRVWKDDGTWGAGGASGMGLFRDLVKVQGIVVDVDWLNKVVSTGFKDFSDEEKAKDCVALLCNTAAMECNGSAHEHCVETLLKCYESSSCSYGVREEIVNGMMDVYGTDNPRKDAFLKLRVIERIGRGVGGEVGENWSRFQDYVEAWV